jgi:Kae1-associated kinase Bud32
MTPKIIFQAAEAIIIKDKDKVIKRRIVKGYRIPVLDEKLRKQRTRSEAKILEKASKIINVPKVFGVNEGKTEIVMQFIKGKKLSDHLDNLKNKNKIAEQIGNEITKLHDNNLIHGDLTTSNMILSEDKVFLIDFGLGFHSQRFEDKAVDLHLLRQALEAKHFKNWKSLFDSVLNGYNPKEKINILKQLEKVESRGRYRH